MMTITTSNSVTVKPEGGLRRGGVHAAAVAITKLSMSLALLQLLALLPLELAVLQDAPVGRLTLAQANVGFRLKP